MALETNIARTFAALSATNEAILYAKSPEELYRQVCEAAFSSGDFLATAIFLLEPGTNMLRLAAGFGKDVVRLRKIGREVELVMFHGESHSLVLTGRPWNRVRHLAAVVDWFRRHLQGDGAPA